MSNFKRVIIVEVETRFIEPMQESVDSLSELSPRRSTSYLSSTSRSYAYYSTPNSMTSPRPASDSAVRPPRRSNLKASSLARAHALRHSIPYHFPPNHNSDLDEREEYEIDEESYTRPRQRRTSVSDRRTSSRAHSFYTTPTYEEYGSSSGYYPTEANNLGPRYETPPPRPRRQSWQPPERRTTKKPPPKAIDEDARRHRIPPGYSLKNWDPSEEPILLLDSVFDANSLGKWIYDWAVHHLGHATPIAETAGELWLLLIQLAGKMKRANEIMPRIRSKENREMVGIFIAPFPWLRSIKQIIKSFQRETPSFAFPFVPYISKYNPSRRTIQHNGILKNKNRYAVFRPSSTIPFKQFQSSSRRALQNLFSISINSHTPNSHPAHRLLSRSEFLLLPEDAINDVRSRSWAPFPGFHFLLPGIH